MRLFWARLLSCGLASLVATAGAEARQRRAAMDAGAFDYYLLSLSIAPSFCGLSAANGAKAECRSLNEAAFEQTPVTLHGLWPNRARVSVNLQPHDCEGPPFAVSETARGELQRYMPGGPGLARYEWRKHGTCSGLEPEAYFDRLVQLGRSANDTIGMVMRDQHMLGRVVRISDLLAGVAAKDPALAGAIVVDCRTPQGGGDVLIDEIRVTLSKDFAPIPAGSVGLGQNSGCPQGAGLVPTVRR